MGRGPGSESPAGPGQSPSLSWVSRVRWKDGALPLSDERCVPEETAVALTYNRDTYAVTMATPADLEDLAVGWSLTEGVIGAAGEIEELEVVTRPLGIELRMWLAASRADALSRRRRRRAGATGCGRCGIESREEAVRAPPPVAGGGIFPAAAMMRAMAALPRAQTLNQATHAVHAAGFWDERDGLVAVREDVGRHNALDKLAGAMVRAGRDAGAGMLLLSSRVSIEMVQKAAILGARVIVAVSAPTAHAVRLAERAGITMVAVARGDGFEVFTHPDRIIMEVARDVA